MSKQKNHSTVLAALLLLLVFAVSVLLVLIIGVDTYHRITERDSVSYDRRICMNYIATKVRGADTEGGVSIERFGGLDALVLGETIDGREYTTRIYEYEGVLMELFSERGAEMSPKAGEKIIETDGVEFSIDNGILNVSCSGKDSERINMTLSLRSGEGASI